MSFVSFYLSATLYTTNHRKSYSLYTLMNSIVNYFKLAIKNWPKVLFSLNQIYISLPTSYTYILITCVCRLYISFFFTLYLDTPPYPLLQFTSRINIGAFLKIALTMVIRRPPLLKTVPNNHWYGPVEVVPKMIKLLLPPGCSMGTRWRRRFPWSWIDTVRNHPRAPSLSAGYRKAGQFSDLFRRSTGMLPTEFRNMGKTGVH